MSGMLISGEGLHRAFPIRPGGPSISALRGVDLSIAAGAAVGVIGESGSGKSTLAKLLLGLDAPDAGRVMFEGVDLRKMTTGQRREFRRRVQPVFQNPYASLNPRMRARAIIAEPMRAAAGLSLADMARRTQEAIERVGLSIADLDRHPAEFSGGQRQRIAIARALAAKPDLLILDEPVSSLDISIRAQVLNLLADLRQERGFAMLMITHDLKSVRKLCDEVAVMYLGRVAEFGRSQAVCGAPAHPYTINLAAADLLLSNPHAPRPGLRAAPPSALAPPPGCPWAPRCEHAIAACAQDMPRLQTVGQRRVACPVLYAGPATPPGAQAP